MQNNIAQFYQKFKSGSDRFTITSGRFFTIIFSFPDNNLQIPTNGKTKGLAANINNVINKTSEVANNLGLGSGLLGTGLSLLSKDIGLTENNMIRFPAEDIKWLVKSINLPNMKLSDTEVILNGGTSSFGTSIMPGQGSIEPESQNFSLDIIPTVESPIENFFTPWMEEVASMRNGGNVPFRRANVFIHVYNENLFTRNANLGGVGNLLNSAGELFNEINVKYTYKLEGVYPNFCDTPNLSHDSSMDNRSIGFSFNKIEYYGNPLVNGALNALKNVKDIGFGISGQQAVETGTTLAGKLKRFTLGGSLNF